MLPSWSVLETVAMSDDPACCAVKLLWVCSARESGDLDLPDAPHASILLPVPSRSRTSEASPGLLLQELNFLDSSAQVSQSIRRQHAALDLVALDGFEQRLEVAFAKAVVTLALDELEEHRPHQGGGEYLQQQPTLAAFR